jgi:hypothetical protein
MSLSGQQSNVPDGTNNSLTFQTASKLIATFTIIAWPAKILWYDYQGSDTLRSSVLYSGIKSTHSGLSSVNEEVIANSFFSQDRRLVQVIQLRLIEHHAQKLSAFFSNAVTIRLKGENTPCRFFLNPLKTCQNSNWL